MKSIVMIVLESCPHCRNAKRWMEELRQEIPAYQAISVDVVDEELQPEISKKFTNYYYVPTYYIDGVKIHEGVPTKDLVRLVFEKALL